MGMQSGIINIIISSFYVFIFLNQVNSTLTFVDPTDQGPSPATISYSAVAYSFLSNPTFSVTARILDLSKQKYCEEDSSFSGSILFVNDAAGCSEEYKIRMCERVGCVGIVAVEAFMVPGYSMRRFKSAETKQKNDLNVPYVIIGLHDGAQLQDFMNHYDTSPLSSNLTNPNQRFLITINSGETNEWEVFVSSTVFIIIWRVIEPLFALSCIVLADWRMWILYKRGRLTGIAAFCLIMQMFSNAIRFLYWAVDPTFSSQIYNWFWSRLFMFVHIPFQIIAAVMIIREWILALKKSRLRISFLSERGISGFFYFSVASLLLLILIELIDSFISGAYFDYNWLSVFTIALETITLLILAIAFFTVSRITLRALNMANASESKTRRNRVRRMANWSIVTASGMLSFVVASIFAMIDELRGNPIGCKFVEKPHSHVVLIIVCLCFFFQISSCYYVVLDVWTSNYKYRNSHDLRRTFQFQ